MRITKKKLAAVAVGTAVTVAGAGVAFAFFTSDGTGEGSATTGTSTEWDIDSSAATGAALTPGSGLSQTIAFTVTNPGSGVQRLEALTAEVKTATGAEWTLVPGCSAADYTVGTPVITYGDVAPAGVVSGTVTITMNETGVNQDGCKDATVPVYFVAS